MFRIPKFKNQSMQIIIRRRCLRRHQTRRRGSTEISIKPKHTYFHSLCEPNSPWTRTAHDLFVTRLINATWKVKGQWSKLIAAAKWSRSSVYVRQAIVTSPCDRRVTVSACIVCCWVVAMGSCFVPAVWVAAFHRILFPSCYMLLCSIWRSLLAIGWHFLSDVVA